MLKIHRLNAPENINDEYNIIENVVAYIVGDFIGHDTVLGYVYINDEGKLRREMCGWL